MDVLKQDAHCALCHEREEALACDQEGAGGLALTGLGPLIPVSRPSRGIVWIHRQCGLWSSEVYTDESSSELVSHACVPCWWHGPPSQLLIVSLGSVCGEYARVSGCTNHLFVPA